jgi:MarR family transcriptional regulator for hemolysin
MSNRRPAERVEQAFDASPWQRVESTLMTTSHAVRRAFDQRFAALELNLSQASVLAFLQESGAMTQTRISERLGIGRAATGTVIDHLETRGLVERKPDAADRRVWLVAVTQAGKDLAAEIDEVDRVLRSELRVGISRAERQQLAKLLLRLQTNLARALANDEA